MKKVIISFLVIGSLFLSGCSQKEETKKQEIVPMLSEETKISNSTRDSTSAPIKDSASHDFSDEKLWNSEKARELNQFVIGWGKTMNQTYREYTPDNNVNLYDLELPRVVLEEGHKWTPVVDDELISLEWSDYGEGDGYKLVAVFSDADTQPYLNKHVYFFTIVSGEPKVLVTSQNQGNEYNYLYFKETDNDELKNGFLNIVGGRDNFEISESKEESETVNLGTIAYKDLDTTDFIQGKAQWLGCSIEDDGTTISLVPEMSATIQNLQLYISGQGNEEYYDSFLDIAKEMSLHTGGKPVSVWSRGGDGEVVVTAQNGSITFSL